jgi:polysaccharide deacetylase 2 family uncharacterized protein YibQ
MARGFFGGLVWGGLTSVVAAGSISLVAGMPLAPEVTTETAPTPAVTAESNAAQVPSASADDAVQQAGLPKLEEELPPSRPLSEALTESAPPPAIQAQTEAPRVPTLAEGQANTPDVASEQAPVVAIPEVLAAPKDETELSISTEPAQPPIPEPAVDSALPQAEARTAAPLEAPVVQAPLETALAEEKPEVSEPVVTAALPQAEATAPRLGVSVVPLTERAPGASGRLPTVGGGVSTTGAPKAIEDFAAPFENLENKPLMAIVLIDAGDSPVGVEALRAFPYPLSFAVDPMRADAEAVMAKYRAAGFEVLAHVNIPQDFTAPDVEQSLTAQFAKLPESMGILEGEMSGLQGSKQISDQVTSMVAASGHGLVFKAKGLDAARKLAEKEGVPAATIFRDFDGEGQGAPTIRRFLDQAAFKAAQEEKGVIMLGRLRPETISALLLWGLQDRAQRVALAPVSAVLLEE